jgi:hypothetical protein
MFFRQEAPAYDEMREFTRADLGREALLAARPIISATVP